MTAFRAFFIVFASIVFAWPPHRTRLTYGQSGPPSLPVQCAVRLLNATVMSRRRATAAVYVTISPEVSQEFRTELLCALHRTHIPTLLLRRFELESFNPNRFVLPHAYLVAAHDPFDLARHLDAINVTGESWRPETNFVVTLETSVEPTADNALKPVFQRFWTGNVFYSVLLVPRMARDHVDALAWYPFHNECGAYHAPKTVDSCNSNSDGGWKSVDGSSGVFADRIPATFDGRCTVKIAAFDWRPMTMLSNHTPRRTMVSGMDVEVIKLMERIGRVRLEVVEVKKDERWGIMAANGSWNGGLGEVSERRADMMIGGGILTVERTKRFRSVSGRQVIRFLLYTPLPRKLPYWQNMSQVFAGSFWATLFTVFVLTVGLLHLSGVSLPSERRAFADLAYCLVVSWAILCSVASGRPPASTSSKMIYLSWVVYVLHISAIYTSMQLVYLYKPKFEAPMRTIDDVKTSGLLVCSVPTFIPIARSMSKENFNLTEYMPCVDMTVSANRLLQQKDIIILDPEEHFEELISANNSMNEVNKLDEVVIVYNVGIYTQKGNPYASILTRAQNVAYESGLHLKWRQDALPSLQNRLKKDKSIKVKKLNIDELQGAFLILVCGLCAGLVVFLLERFFGTPD